MVELAFIIPGGGELWVILAILLILFGAKKLPDLARSMGSSITQFKKGLREGQDLPDRPKLERPKDEHRDET